MIDTFKPLSLTKDAIDWELEDYYRSWIGEKKLSNA